MIKDTATKIEETLERAEGLLVARGLPFTPYDTALVAAVLLSREDPDEWAAICLAGGLNYVSGMVQRRTARALRPVDDRQGLLAFPEYARVPQVIEVEGGFIDLNESTLEQYDNSTAALENRIKSYDYPRRSEAKLKRDKEQLSQRLKLRKKVATYFAGDPEMKMGQAMRLHFESLETPAAEHNRKIAKRFRNRQKGRT